MGILKPQHDQFEQGNEYYIDIQQLSKPFQSSSAGGLDNGLWWTYIQVVVCRHSFWVITMNQAIEQIIYSALNKNEPGAGVGSTATVDDIIKGIKPYYQAASEAEKQAIIIRLSKLKAEPGVPIPSNIEKLLRT